MRTLTQETREQTLTEAFKFDIEEYEQYMSFADNIRAMYILKEYVDKRLEAIEHQINNRSKIHPDYE